MDYASLIMVPAGQNGTAGGRASETVTVDPDEADRRLDNFLLARLKGVPRTHVYRIIRSGEVRVNSRRAGPRQRLEAGDRVRIPPFRSVSRTLPAPRPESAAWIETRVLYEDEALLVLDKPAGLAVHGGSGVSLGAVELLRAARPKEKSLGLVHRLDRDTSGCLLFARKSSSLRRLQAQFREGSVEKTYLALLIGRLQPWQRVVDAPLLTSERRGGERWVRIDPAGKAARTHFAVERRFPAATLARVTLLTGRTHQIRVHAAGIGLPIVGDPRYGAEPDTLAAAIGLRRLFLHAAVLAFASPDDGRVIRVESPLPDELEAVLRRLEADRTVGVAAEFK
ncbi:MAG: RluA family pseudouridine synthase [Gammaproteobacteria bacterium]|nr:RluA family pseudouridine synthase [Gammaproteobacteria bacterium]